MNKKQSYKKRVYTGNPGGDGGVDYRIILGNYGGGGGIDYKKADGEVVDPEPDKKDKCCCDYKRNGECSYQGRHKICEQPDTEEQEIKDITFDLVEMIMRIATSKKKNETFYVNKVSQELDKLIAKKLARERQELIEDIWKWVVDNGITDKKSFVALRDKLQAIKEKNE